MNISDKYIKHGGLHFHKDTPREVMDLLALYWQSDVRLRIFLGTPDEYWLEQHDVMGTIGRSTGDIKVPLLMSTICAKGGGAILTDRIMMITVDKKIVYKHPDFKIKAFKIVETIPKELKDIGFASYGVYYEHEDELLASFESRVKAERYVAFMEGKRNKL